jgi:NADPH:quinone reductase-like Zn-dependent oxidoreductase/acyl carrier protein
MRERGSLDNLQVQPLERRRPAAGEVELRIYASSLNFGDVLYAMDMYPGPNGGLGFDCAGVVVAVGEDVHDFHVGDEVVTMTPNSFNEYVIAKAALLVHKPAQLNFAEAASIPEVFVTAHYCLHHLAQMGPGDRVLIHAATGGVGMATIQLAQRAGAEVFATASPGKWETLRSLGVKHIYNSRTLDYGDQILADTDGKGVTLILNSLTGAGYIDKNLAVLAAGGRFVEISMRDAWDIQRMKAQRPDMQYFLVDVGEEMKRQSALIQSIMGTLMQEFAAGHLHPLPRTEFPLARAADAFRMMQQAKHIGKIVVTQAEEQPLAIHPNGAYLITGGLGGLGLVLARWLADQGARHLVLLGRSAPTADAQSQLDALEADGIRVTVAGADVTNLEELAAIFAHFGKDSPLRGIIHAAGVLSDSSLLNETWENFAHVLDPKVQGAWNLHCLSLEHPLDFFVCFGSDTGLLGHRGQANYAAANVFLDALAHHRRAAGLPALSVDWGAWADVGMAANLQDALARQGLGMIPPAQGTAILGKLLSQTFPQVSVLPIDWQTFAGKQGTEEPSAFLSQLIRPEAAPQRRQQRADLRDRLDKANARQRHDLLITTMQEEVQRVIGGSQPPSPQQGFFAMGFDSLMTIEVRNRLQSLLGLSLPPTLLFKYPSIQELVDYLEEQLAPAEAETEPAPAPSEEQTETAASGEQGEQGEQNDLETLLSERFQKLTTLLED